jgi:hypothetical protein
VHKHKNRGETKKMPRGDKTGPYGAGPMTGRVAGYCAGYTLPGYMNQRRGYGRGYGRGWGRGFGRGWGRGWCVYPPQVIVQPGYPQVTSLPQTPQQEVTALESYHEELTAEKADIEKEIVDIKKRIDELKAKLENKETEA